MIKNMKLKKQLFILFLFMVTNFLMNRNELTKKSHSDRRDLDLYLLSQFHYNQVFVVVGLIRFKIPFLITFCIS